MGLHPDLLDGLDDMGFTEATPIQAQAIPAAIDGKDLLAIAQTGTGKTGAFLLPVLDRLCDKPHDDVDTLIITPTRELAMQIEGQIEGLTYYAPISSISVYGGRDGHALDSERNAMKAGVDIIVATPGRLKTHLQMGHLDLSKVRTLILDEADRMLDMGFVDDIMQIVSKLPKQRQTLLFSATFPSKIQKLARELLDASRTEEIRIAISKPPASIKQTAYYVDDSQKDNLVAHILKERTDLKRVIVFANRKSKVRELLRTLQRRKLDVAAVESGMEQADREKVLRQFRNGTVRIVVATDVLSRGIDVKDIDMVVNYDVPGGAEDYVHRIGRTARADTDGEAITLVNGRDRKNFIDIEELIERKVDHGEIPEWLEKSSSRDRDSRGGRDDRGGNRGRGRGNREGGRDGKGRPFRGSRDGKRYEGNPGQAPSENGHSDNSHPDNGRAENGRAENGRAENGRAENGRADADTASAKTQVGDTASAKTQDGDKSNRPPYAEGEDRPKRRGRGRGRGRGKRQDAAADAGGAAPGSGGSTGEGEAGS